MTNKPDLHALANLPGAGKAFEVLSKAGLIGQDPTAPKWSVMLYGVQSVATMAIVRAETATEAHQIARAMAERHELAWEDMASIKIDASADISRIEDHE